jgi:Domain of unknown function (DUF4404)
MDKQRLINTLQRLHTELAETEQADPETLMLLRAVTEDISRLLEKDQEALPEDVDPVTRGLKDLLLKFESEHPRLSARLGEVADALASMGL